MESREGVDDPGTHGAPEQDFDTLERDRSASNRTPPPEMGTEWDPHDIVVGKVVSEKDTPNLSEVWFRVLPHRHTTTGRILGVRGDRPSGEPVLTLIRVENVHEHNPHEDALSSTVSDVIPFETRYSPEGRSTVIYRAAVAEPLEEAVLDQDGSLVRIDGVETLPRAGSPVVEVSPEIVAETLNLASDPEDGLNVGTVPGLGDVPALIHKSAVQTHMFLTGGIGRGKSYARGVIAEELAAHGVPQVNIDPMGEMVEPTEALGGQNLQPGDGFTMPLSALEAHDVLDAIPGINPSTNYATLIAYAHDSLLQERVLKRGQHFGVSDLIKQIEQAAPRLDMEQKSTLGRAKQRARTLTHLDFIGRPFPWEDELKPGAIINIDCRGRMLRDLRLIAASVARDIQRLAKTRDIPFVVLSFDEAHLITPDENVITTQVLREIARIGRHYRIGLILTTQSPADMDRSILKRMLTRFLFAIEPDQLAALKGVFSDAPESVVDHLPKLPVGTALVTGVSETVRHATVVRIRERKTPVGGKTPDVFADLREWGWPGRKEYDDIIFERQEGGGS